MVTQNQEQTRAAWNAIAAGYDTFVTEPGRQIAEDALVLAGLQPGMRVLDVASGSGAVSIPAARLGANVVAVDLSPNMIELLRARAREQGFSNLEGHVMDGHSLDLSDDAFDITISQFGVMLFPDLPRGLSEMTRVTKPGGKVALVVYAAPPTIDFLTFFIGAMHATIPGFTGLPDDPPPLPFQASDPDVLRRHFANAGLTNIRIEQGAEVLTLQTGQDLWDWVANSNPIAVMLTADLTAQQRTNVIRTMDEMLRERAAGNGPATLTNPVHIGIGTKPPTD
ncbi:MAG TPA: methyltransferase domain-containing protein [Thermomicrobiales bacterium]|nr:methyltransferase domain-containing protein [Thermomicrobiales bacterium]